MHIRVDSITKYVVCSMYSVSTIHEWKVDRKMFFVSSRRPPGLLHPRFSWGLYEFDCSHGDLCKTEELLRCTAAPASANTDHIFTP